MSMSTEGDLRLSRRTPLLLDRCISPPMAEGLRKFGYTVIPMRDHYGQRDAQFVSDVEWIRDAHENGWAVLTANPKILSTPHEIDLIEELGVRVFCLASAQHNRETRGLVVGRHLLTIQRRWVRNGPVFWRLDPARITKDIG